MQLIMKQGCSVLVPFLSALFPSNVAREKPLEGGLDVKLDVSVPSINKARSPRKLPVVYVLYTALYFSRRVLDAAGYSARTWQPQGSRWCYEGPLKVKRKQIKILSFPSLKYNPWYIWSSCKETSIFATVALSSQATIKNSSEYKLLPL